MADFKIDVINTIKTHTERPVSLGDRETYYKDLNNMGKTKDIGKTQELKSNKSDDISALLHHSKSTTNADLTHSTNDENGGVILAKIPCNDQPDKNWVILTRQKSREVVGNGAT